MKAKQLWLLVLASAILMSLPWLVPHTGVLALVGLIPLLCAEELACEHKVRHFWIWHYSCFVLWNAFTTFWICNATVGGGIFAVLANALQMSLIFGLFRFSKRKLKGVLPYIFLACMWIAWERWYLVSAQISWPWLVLGNAFARSTHMIQWYSITGSLGGSLWVWACNLGLFGILFALGSGRWQCWNSKAKVAAILSLVLVTAGPMLTSSIMYNSYEEKAEGSIDVLIAQPNLDPYHKFESMSQSQQNDLLLDLYREALSPADTASQLLLLAPETMTNDIWLPDYANCASWQKFNAFLQDYPNANLLFGASTYEFRATKAAPGPVCYPYRGGWLLSHNSALMTDASGRTEVFHKSKLVVGTELTPYPKFFVPLDDWLCKTFNIHGPMIARCVGQDEVSLLHFRRSAEEAIPIGTAVCYESVYGEYCTEYARKGAEALTVITNDSWWGNTPGYMQHLSYSCLRAIELRRDIARCGNTGISCFIDQKGDIKEKSQWWEPATLSGSVNLNTEISYFAEHGDIVGRICVLAFLLLLALIFVRMFIPTRSS